MRFTGTWILVVAAVLLIIWWCLSSQKEGLGGSCLSEFKACDGFVTGMEEVCRTLSGEAQNKCRSEANAMYKVCLSLNSPKCIDSTWCDEVFKGMIHACEKYAPYESCKERAQKIYQHCREK